MNCFIEIKNKNKNKQRETNLSSPENFFFFSSLFEQVFFHLITMNIRQATVSYDHQET